MADTEYDDLYGDLYPGEAEYGSGAASTSAAPATESAAPAPAAAATAAPTSAPAVSAIPSFSDKPVQQQQQFGGGNQGGANPPPLHFAPGYASQRANEGRTGGVRPSDMPEEGKMFIGGLNWDTTDDTLKAYFEQFGKITHCTIMRDVESGRSRGFAFLTFEDPSSVNAVMAREHHLDGKTIDPKRAIPRSDTAKTDKLFVRALPASCTQESFRSFWRQFGNITDATLMMDKETGRHRGFGFVNYEDRNTVDKVLQSGPHYMDGQMLEVKRAQNKNEARRPDYGVNTNQNQAYTPQPNSGGGNMGMGMGGGMNNMGGGMNNMMGGGMGGMAAGGMGGTPFDPVAMSKFFSQMGWGAFNPMMMGNMGGMGGMGMGNMGGMGMGGMGMGGFGGMGAGGMGGFGGGMGGGMGGDGSQGAIAGGGGEGGSTPGGGGSEQGQGQMSQWTAPMSAQGAAAQPRNAPASRPGGGRGGGGMGRGGGRAGFNPPTGPAAMRNDEGGAGPQRNRGSGAGFHPYSR